MVDRTHYPAGVPCWVDTAQPDAEAAMAFYGGLFGWEFADVLPAGAPGRYIVARLGGRDVAAIGWAPDDPPRSPQWSTYVAVDDLAATAVAVIEAGGDVVVPAADMGDAGRMAVFADPAAAVFLGWQAGSHAGARAVNEPGTWNWSGLETRDPAGAVAFYRAVFGWEPLGGLDASGGGLWALPGYGDYLATIDPDLRARQAAAGVPPGFADAVAWLRALSPDTDPALVPSRWGVVFAVDDADAAVARLESLGGTVLVPTFEAGPTRQAVVADPEGAQFTLSAYTAGA
jgi:predicted enzyme related to lactoylglutathione lyase